MSNFSFIYLEFGLLDWLANMVHSVYLDIWVSKFLSHNSFREVPEDSSKLRYEKQQRSARWGTPISRRSTAAFIGISTMT